MRRPYTIWRGATVSDDCSPVLVPSDTRNVVSISGKDYDVWVTALSGYRLTLAPH